MSSTSLLAATLALAQQAPGGLGSEPGPETRREEVSVKKTHSVAVANTLWDLAAFYYEDPWQWPRIYEANRERIRDPHWIYPGQVFVIPGLDKLVTIVAPGADGGAAAETAPAEEEPEPEPFEFSAGKQPGAITLPDSLSTELPPGFAGQQPALYRMRLPDAWRPHGTVVEFGGREAMVAAGDLVSVRLSDERGARKGARYTIFRRTARAEADVDAAAKYAQKVGLLELVRKTGKGEYRARVLASGGTVMLDDLLQLER